MSYRNIRRCSMSLIIRERQIKASHLSEWSLSKKPRRSKHGQGCGEKNTLVHCWWAHKLVQPLWRRVGRFPETLKIELSYDLSTPFAGVSKDMKSLSWRAMCTPMFTAAAFTTIKVWKQSKYLLVNNAWKCDIYMSVCTHTHTQTHTQRC